MLKNKAHLLRVAALQETSQKWMWRILWNLRSMRGSLHVQEHIIFYILRRIECYYLDWKSHTKNLFYCFDCIFSRTDGVLFDRLRNQVISARNSSLFNTQDSLRNTKNSESETSEKTLRCSNFFYKLHLSTLDRLGFSCEHFTLQTWREIEIPRIYKPAHISASKQTYVWGKIPLFMLILESRHEYPKKVSYIYTVCDVT